MILFIGMMVPVPALQLLFLFAVVDGFQSFAFVLLIIDFVDLLIFRRFAIGRRDFAVRNSTVSVFHFPVSISFGFSLFNRFT